MTRSAIKTITLKGISLFLYLNILRVFIVLVALYFSALFIFNTEKSSLEILSQWPFHCIVLASLFSISAGYIIHYFYEEELLRIQSPFQTYFKQFLSKNEYLRLYLTLNVISLLLVSWLSWKILLFFMGYQFLIWLYAHKLSVKMGWANFSKTILTLLPFLALMIYFQNYSAKVLLFGSLLFILIFLKEFLKDFVTVQSDSMFEHESIPIALGVKNALPWLSILLVIAIGLNLFLALRYDLGIMEFYLYSSALVYVLILALVHSGIQLKFNWALTFLKLWIFVGILSIPFINWDIQSLVERI